jgi:hypothetical protein
MLAKIHNAKCGMVIIDAEIFWCNVPEKFTINPNKKRVYKVEDKSIESAQWALDKFLEG